MKSVKIKKFMHVKSVREGDAIEVRGKGGGWIGIMRTREEQEESERGLGGRIAIMAAMLPTSRTSR